MQKVRREYSYTYQIAIELEPGVYKVLEKHASHKGDMLAIRLCNKLQREDPTQKYVVVRVPKLIKEIHFEG